MNVNNDRFSDISGLTGPERSPPGSGKVSKAKNLALKVLEKLSVAIKSAADRTRLTSQAKPYPRTQTSNKVDSASARTLNTDSSRQPEVKGFTKGYEGVAENLWKDNDSSHSANPYGQLPTGGHLNNGVIDQPGYGRIPSGDGVKRPASNTYSPIPLPPGNQGASEGQPSVAPAGKREKSPDYSSIPSQPGPAKSNYTNMGLLKKPKGNGYDDAPTTRAKAYGSKESHKGKLPSGYDDVSGGIKPPSQEPVRGKVKTEISYGKLPPDDPKNGVK